MSDAFEITAAITNATNKHAPFNPYTYGAVNYNPSFTQDGAVGRFFTVGARFNF